MVFDGLQKGALSTAETMAEMMTSPIWAPMGRYSMAVGPRAVATAAGSADNGTESDGGTMATMGPRAAAGPKAVTGARAAATAGLGDGRGRTKRRSSQASSTSETPLRPPRQ
jgi:hypothetical protein